MLFWRGFGLVVFLVWFGLGIFFASFVIIYIKLAICFPFQCEVRGLPFPGKVSIWEGCSWVSWPAHYTLSGISCRFGLLHSGCLDFQQSPLGLQSLTKYLSSEFWHRRCRWHSDKSTQYGLGGCIQLWTQALDVRVCIFRGTRMTFGLRDRDTCIGRQKKSSFTEVIQSPSASVLCWAVVDVVETW